MTNAERIAALKTIWKKTHRDYKGIRADGTKAILVLRNGGTHSVPLTELTDEEISERI